MKYISKILLLSFLLSVLYSSATTTIQKEDTKELAFAVLEAKCNVCHIKRNPRKVFTSQNMERFASKINKQVFIKKRMPKGKKIKLTEQDKAYLMKWLENLKINKQ